MIRTTNNVSKVGAYPMYGTFYSLIALPLRPYSRHTDRCCGIWIIINYNNNYNNRTFYKYEIKKIGFIFLYFR